MKRIVIKNIYIFICGMFLSVLLILFVIHKVQAPAGKYKIVMSQTPVIASTAPSITSTVLAATTKSAPTHIPHISKHVVPSTNASLSCNGKTSLQVSSSTVSNIRKLDEYQKVCGSFVANQLMIFTDIPSSESNAASYAVDMAIMLKDFASFKITPYVIVEPTNETGNIAFSDFENGNYDFILSAYFKNIKNQGVTDSQMGVWIPFPEPNLVEWKRDNTTPADFSSIINKYFSILKSYFPTSHGSILLASQTFEKNTYSQGGNFISLLPYVSGISKGYIDSFGLQGFPWYPAAGVQDTPISDPGIFLDHNLAIEAAKSLGVKMIWFNTGTFSAMYTDDKSKTIHSTSAQRGQLLDGILNQAVLTKAQGYNVTVNLFAQDKTNTGEATNWSYFMDNGNKQVFKDFVSRAYTNGIQLSIFDDYK